MKNSIFRFSKKCLYFLLLTLILNSCSQKAPEPIIGKAGKTTIPLSEFKERYEFTPHIMQTKNKERNVRNAAASLLGEKLLTEEAYHRKLQKTEKFQTYHEQMENEAIVEELFEKEIAAKVQIDESEIKKGFLRSQSELDLQVLTFNNQQDALEAKKQIDAGKSLNQVKREFQTDSFISADSVLTISMKWGDAHPTLEDAAFNLKPDEVSEPVFVDGNYFILKLVQKRSNVFITELDYINKSPSIKKNIIQRKRTELMADFMKNAMKGKEVNVGHEIFNFVAEELEKNYGVKDSLSKSETNMEAHDNSDNQFKKGDLASHLNDTFARFNDGSVWTVQDFIKKLTVGPYAVNRKNSNAFKNSLRRIIKRMIEFETMAKIGRELGLDKTYYVHYQTKMWTDSYLAQEMRQNIIDTVQVSDAEIEYYYDKHKNDYAAPEMVNLQEILVDKESLARNIYRRLKNGENISKLARLYNKRELTQKKAGNMGYFSTSALGKIGEVARNLRIGEIGGPVKTEQDQYSVFLLKDKKEAGPEPLEKVWSNVKRDALVEKRLRAIDGELIDLSDKYNIQINQAVLDTVQTYDINMMVFKRHYANRTAAPLVTPLNKSYRWQNLFDEKFQPKK